jgi:hypothetical protein
MHRGCWQLAGACPLRERHGPEFSWQPTIAPQEPEPPAPETEDSKAPEEPGVLICPTCGEHCPPGTETCPECGTQFNEFFRSMKAHYEQETRRREQMLRESFPTYNVHGRNVTMGDTLAGEQMEDIALQLRGSRHAITHYLEAFEGGRKLGWNWAAFFAGLFGPFWFFFRKLYKEALIFGALWLIAALAFLPAIERVVEPVLPAYNQLAESIASSDSKAMQEAQRQFYNAFRQSLRQHKLTVGLKTAQVLLLAIASGLLADPLLRRRVWANMERARAEVVTDGPDQSYGRHQLLIRLGGISFFAPVLWLWVYSYLPQVIVNVVEKILG